MQSHSSSLKSSLQRPQLNISFSPFMTATSWISISSISSRRLICFSCWEIFHSIYTLGQFGFLDFVVAHLVTFLTYSSMLSDRGGGSNRGDTGSMYFFPIRFKRDMIVFWVFIIKKSIIFKNSILNKKRLNRTSHVNKYKYGLPQSQMFLFFFLFLFWSAPKYLTSKIG